MRTLVCYLLLTAIALAQPSSVRFDGRDLLRVDTPKEAAAGIRIYRSQSFDPNVPEYEVGIVRLKDAPADWSMIRESLLRVVRKKASLFDAVVRGGPDVNCVMVDFGYLRPDGTTFEYAILKHSLTAERELITVDARIRFPAGRKDLVSRIRKDREALVSEFAQLAQEIVK